MQQKSNFFSVLFLTIVCLSFSRIYTIIFDDKSLDIAVIYESTMGKVHKKFFRACKV